MTFSPAAVQLLQRSAVPADLRPPNLQAALRMVASQIIAGARPGYLKEGAWARDWSGGMVYLWSRTGTFDDNGDFTTNDGVWIVRKADNAGHPQFLSIAHIDTSTASLDALRTYVLVQVGHTELFDGCANDDERRAFVESLMWEINNTST